MSERLMACLGDSITAGSPLWDPDEAVRGRIGEALDERSQFQWWAGEREPGLRFRNCGVYGERTDQIAARLPGCAEGADVLVVQGGINDVAQGREPVAAAKNLRAMVGWAKDAGLPVALADVLPWNNGYPASAGPIAELNELVHALASEEGVRLLPFHDTLEDPARPGRMPDEWTSDGDHPSIEGYRLLGVLVADRLLDELGRPPQ